MVGTSERRVGKLRLAASSEAGARRGLILLEDALRTASMPGADAGRVLVVRSLALGKFRAGQSSAAVAVAIESRLGQLRTQAVYALDPSAARAQVVYFEDDTECSLALAARLARGEDVRAWFWPLAAPDWRPSLPLDEALRRLLYASMRTRSGAVAAASLMRELRVSGGVEVMLAALRPADGPGLLLACAWRLPSSPSPFAPSSAPSADEELKPPDTRAQDLLARWADTWGVDDARSLWLAALLLTEVKPTRVLDARLTSRALLLIERVTTRAADTVAAKAPGRISQAQSGTSNERLHARLSSEAETTRRLATMPDAPGHEHPARLEKEGYAVEQQAPAAGVDAGSHVEAEMKPANVNGVPRTSAADVMRVSNESSDEGAQNLRGAGAPPAPPDSPPDLTPTPHEAGVSMLSDGAGLFFLVPILSRLGIVALLEEQPHLVELNFPQRLLRYVGRRVGIPEDDPVLSVLAVEVDELVPPPGLTALVEEWTRRAQSWCRRSARIGMRELVRREGRLLWTRTHIDLFFDSREADIRIRKSALDVDPGWVSWLGRVVLFHYREQADEVW